MEEVTLILTKDSYAIAEHAVSKGFIRASELPAIKGRQESDRSEGLEAG